MYRGQSASKVTLGSATNRKRSCTSVILPTGFAERQPNPASQTSAVGHPTSKTTGSVSRGSRQNCPRNMATLPGVSIVAGMLAMILRISCGGSGHQVAMFGVGIQCHYSVSLDDKHCLIVNAVLLANLAQMVVFRESVFQQCVADFFCWQR